MTSHSSETPASAERSRTIHYHAPDTDKQALFARSGLEQLQAVATGKIPGPPISGHIGLDTVSLAEGDVVMTAVPDESHYNLIGSVHGGFFATVLDTVCGCAVHTTLPAGVGYTSLEIKVSFLRPITADTGPVTAHGWVTKRGKGVAFADADIRDQNGRVLATASSTCLIIHPRAAS
ncbi:PaaI family thioesterase [Leucobacter massiliensis]|uniref:Aromatic compound degradation protein PaaI n=1 Tax=Leucobacter massiliensis TaxID=1686285 RepID=A0A2S9QLH7_9MICO|nr:PaaI family thioesterase [Leucobacter massiliensis]PRI10448.1 aromatic compound degradation protein PaaI [Leucobacter massiliensis]